MSSRKVISIHNCTQYKPRGGEKKTFQKKYTGLINQIQKANGNQVNMQNSGRTKNVKILRKIQGELRKNSCTDKFTRNTGYLIYVKYSTAFWFSDKYARDQIFQINKGVKADRVDLSTK